MATIKAENQYEMSLDHKETGNQVFAAFLDVFLDLDLMLGISFLLYAFCVPNQFENDLYAAE